MVTRRPVTAERYDCSLNFKDISPHNSRTRVPTRLSQRLVAAFQRRSPGGIRPMRGCILGEFEFIAIQNLSMFNPRLERGEIRRGKVAARVNFVALPPFEIAHCSFSPVHSRLSAFSFQRYFIGARMFAFPREKLIRTSERENFHEIRR